MELFGMLLMYVGGAGAIWYAFWLLFGLIALVLKKIAPNSIKDEYHQTAKKMSKRLIIKVVIGLVALGVGYLLMHLNGSGN